LLGKADHPRRQFAGVGKENRTLIGIQNPWQQGGFGKAVLLRTPRFVNTADHKKRCPIIEDTNDTLSVKAGTPSETNSISDSETSSSSDSDIEVFVLFINAFILMKPHTSFRNKLQSWVHARSDFLAVFYPLFDIVVTATSSASNLDSVLEHLFG
jgi:hypothetical protein